jgi:signal transduction histidine kinase/ligand-binding sensor domain-containing protein
MRTLLLILFVILLNGTVPAQENFRFTTYGVNEGLVQSSIDEITQDANGFLWVGTAGGLCRFDGYHFSTYKQSAQDPHAIPSDRGFHFYTDQSGKLWVISYFGISQYNSTKDNFNNLLVYTPKNVITIENHIFGEDENYLWAGLCSYGIVKILKQTGKVIPINLTKSSQRPTINAWYHGFLEKERLWIVDNNEFNKPVFSIYNTLTQKTDSLPIEVTDIINLNDSEVLGLSGKNILLINKKTLAYKTILITDNGADPNILSMIKESAEEVLLCSPTKGLFYLNTRSGLIIKHISITDPENKKSILSAKCAYKDRSGNTWIGSNSDGLQKITAYYKRFRLYRSEIPNGNNIFSVFADSSKVYIGAQGHGLSVFERGNGFIKNFTLNSKLPSIVNNGFTIAGWGKEKLLVIANNSIKNKNNLITSFSKVSGKVGLLNKEVQNAFANFWGRGNLRHFLIPDINGTYLTNVGEYLISLTECKPGPFCPNVINQFAGETLATCFRDKNRRLWVGTYQYIFVQSTTGWEKINLPKIVEIKNINQDPEGNIWIATPNEMFVINGTHKIIQHYTEETGLSNGHVYGILRDEDGNMWFSHNKGLSVYRWKEKKFIHYDKDDGLQSAEFNAGAFFKAADGELFFGGINGVTSFYPREILSNTHTPAVKITGIKIFDVPYHTDTAYWNIRKLVLPFTENSISFEFAMPEYTNPLKNKYAIMMEGVDEKWINAGDRRFTRYAGLHPGHYVFNVRAANNDGITGKEITSIDITIVPPFWQRPWFIAAMIVLFVFLSIGIGIWIQKIRQEKAIQALEVQHKIQLERERISRDLHDNVGTQLSLISKNIEGAIDPSQNITDAERLQNLSAISLTSKEVIFTLRETIWALNKEEISLEELSDKLKAFTQKLFALNRKCRLLYTENITDENVVLSPSEAIHLFRICQEAITNSLKYANAGAMDISIHSANGRYSISIADDGIGFEPGITRTTAHYGLENMKFRADEIACSFSIDTMPGKGTKITISKK